MIIDDRYYDVIIVGTGAGGGTLTRKLASTGKKILVLERGEFLEKESSELVEVEVFKKEDYHAPEHWYENAGEPFHPQTCYSVGGNTKMYSGTLLRMREKDFELVQHQDGISPEWGLKYQDFEPYYTEAEKLYRVHGKAGDDPTEPYRSEDYPFSHLEHEANIQNIGDRLTKYGLHPAYLPIGIGDEGRTDSEDTGVSPAIKAGGDVTLKTSAKVVSLHTNPNNRVTFKGSKLYLDYTPNNTEAHDRLLYRWQEVLKATDKQSRGIHPYGSVPIQVVAHQCGTCRFGEDPKSSVLDLNCRTHDLDNLYVVDSSFFPSNAAVSPALTVIANALRVGDKLIARLG